MSEKIRVYLERIHRRALLLAWVVLTGGSALAAPLKDSDAPKLPADDGGRYARLINDPVMRGVLAGMKTKYHRPYCWIPESQDVSWRCDGFCEFSYTISCELGQNAGIQTAVVHGRDFGSGSEILSVEFVTAVP